MNLIHRTGKFLKLKSLNAFAKNTRKSHFRYNLTTAKFAGQCSRYPECVRRLLSRNKFGHVTVSDTSGAFQTIGARLFFANFFFARFDFPLLYLPLGA